ncbi:MAG TPA: cell division protein FtsL [Gammaproteobacteria bacterium]|nr:cell division protein FtsL [Gammaproteobacteria bacterium]
MNTRLLALLLGLAVLITALSDVYAVHRNRLLFIELQQLKQQRDALNIEWGRLQLEESAWGAQARVEQIAREKLNMHRPARPEIIIIRKP